MIFALRIALMAAGALLIAASPWLWQWKPASLWLVVPLVVAWGVWLMIEYLRWARTLTRRTRRP